MNKFAHISLGKQGLPLIAAAVLSLYSLPSFAQLPSDAERAATGSASAGRVDEQFKDREDMPDVSPSVQVRDVVLQKVPPGAENIRFTLKSINLNGVTAYRPDDLRSVYADKIGTTITLADVYGIATAMTNKYRNEGYILTQVVVPPQTISGGTVELRVVEGYIDQVIVQGKDDENALQLIRAYAAKMQTGKALNVHDLERYLLLINDLPGVEARSILSPSRTQTGAADLRIIITRDPYDALLAADNYGSRYLGPLQGTAAASVNSFFGNNERITGQFVLAPDFSADGYSNELAYFSVSYEQPLGTEGTKILFRFDNTNTEPGYDLQQFDVSGHSQLALVEVKHPFIRSRSENLSAYVSIYGRDVSSKNNLEPERNDRIRAGRIGADYDFLDTLFGNRNAGINSLRVSVTQGLDILGSSDEGDLRLTRASGDPQFTKMNLEIQRLQRLSSELNVLAVVRGQWSADPLLSSEEFGVGGINTARGFDPSEIVGDDGLAGKVELQWNEPYPVDLLQDYQLYSFFDSGVVWNQDAIASNQKRNTLTSAGVGIRTDFMDDTEAGLAIAFPLNRDVETQGDRDPKVYFNVNRRF